MDFKRSNIKWDKERIKKAVLIAMEAERTAIRLSAGIEQKFGTGDAFDEYGKPVCAFGCVLAAAKCVPPKVAKAQLMSKRELNKLVEVDGDENFTVTANTAALADTLGVVESSLRYSGEEYSYSTLYTACGDVSDSNDDTKPSWERRRGRIAKALRNFSLALLQDAGVL